MIKNTTWINKTILKACLYNYISHNLEKNILLKDDVSQTWQRTGLYSQDLTATPHNSQTLQYCSYQVLHVLPGSDLIIHDVIRVGQNIVSLAVNKYYSSPPSPKYVKHSVVNLKNLKRCNTFRVESALTLPNLQLNRFLVV